MFRQIVAMITLIALLLSATGCSRVITITTEDAVNKKKLNRGTPTTVKATTLELKNGTVVDFDSLGASYLPQTERFQGRTLDGRDLDLPSSTVKKLSVTRTATCYREEQVLDVKSFSWFHEKWQAAAPLSVDMYPVIGVRLKDGTKVRLDGGGLMYDCGDSTLAGRTSKGMTVTISENSVESYMYRKPDVSTTIGNVFILASIAVAVFGLIIANEMEGYRGLK